MVVLQFHEVAQNRARGRYPHMSGPSETERRRHAAQHAAMRKTVIEVHAQAVLAGMTEPGILEDFLVGALQLEWPWLSDDAARDLVRQFKPE